jgi:tRNA1(Val) A37 N6-methylase TrmN6
MNLSEEPQSLDRLAGDWRIWQLRRGHRFSADDLLTAWVASSLAPETRSMIDIGAGIGSVGLLTLWRLPPDARLVMVEVQEVSHQLARRTIAENGLGDRIEARLGDLRDPSVIPETAAFPLVTGSPPYVPPGKGSMSPVPQRAGARMELRGSIYDYARTAARIVRPDGLFVCCFVAADPRGEDALLSAGFHLRVRQDIVFRAPSPPLITVLAGSLTPGPTDRREPLVIRDPTGEWTEPYLQVREAMGTVLDRERYRGGR